MIPASPLLDLRIEIEGCLFDVYVNGGLITRNLEGNIVTENQPINHWVRSGANEIEVFTYRQPDEPDTSEIKLTLSFKDADDERAPGVTAMVLAHSGAAAAEGNPTAGSSPAGLFDSYRGFHSSDKGDFRVGPARIVRRDTEDDLIEVVTRSFDVHLPFPEWAFFKGEKLKQGWEMKTREEMMPSYGEILAAYLKLWALLDRRDIAAFVDACEERNREIDLAYFKRPGETRAQLAKQVEAAMNDDTLELPGVQPPPGKFWKYSVGSKGNLIALTQGSRGSPIFRYQRKDDTPFSVVIPVVFRRDASRYIVTR